MHAMHVTHACYACMDACMLCMLRMHACTGCPRLRLRLNTQTLARPVHLAMYACCACMHAMYACHAVHVYSTHTVHARPHIPSAGNPTITPKYPSKATQAPPPAGLGGRFAPPICGLGLILFECRLFWGACARACVLYVCMHASYACMRSMHACTV